MKLQVPFIQLPLVFDAAALAAEIDALGESPWKPHPQGFPGNSMLPLVAVDADPDNESFAGRMQPTPHLARCPALTHVFASLGATVGRSRLMRLSGKAEVARHADQGYYWAERVRVHVPIVTQPTVRFECADAAIHMTAGECWIFDTWRQHRVINDATQARIHLVVDTVGGGGFWDLVAQGRPHDAPRTQWVPRQVPASITPVTFACEAVNVPAVMSPWELNAHLSVLFADAVPHANLIPVRQVTLRFARSWQGLWFAHGDSGTGRDAYRELLQTFVDSVRGPSQPLMLKNELRWFGAFMTIIGKFALGADVAERGGAAQQRDAGDNA